MNIILKIFKIRIFGKSKILKIEKFNFFFEVDFLIFFNFRKMFSSKICFLFSKMIRYLLLSYLMSNPCEWYRLTPTAQPVRAVNAPRKVRQIPKIDGFCQDFPKSDNVNMIQDSDHLVAQG